MPPLFTSRLRKHSLLSFLPFEKQFKFEKLNNRLYLFSSLLFVIGSIFFLPYFINHGSLGAKIFTLGILISLIPSFHDFHEVINHHHFENLGLWNYLEIITVLFYLVGTFNYLIGNFFFIFKPHNSYFAGIYFLIGSIFFTIAAIINLMLATQEKSFQRLMIMNANAVCNIVGGTLFIVASIPYLWNNFSLNLNELMAFQFIFGSLAFLIGSILAQIYTKIKIAEFTSIKNKV